MTQPESPETPTQPEEPKVAKPKKLRPNMKRLAMTLGVLGTSAGLLAAAAWYKAPLHAFQPQGDPVLIGEATPEEAAALGEAAPEPGTNPAWQIAAQGGPAAVDPVRELRGSDADDLLGPKAGKYGPTDMALPATGADVGEAAGAGQPLSAALRPAPDTPLESGAVAVATTTGQAVSADHQADGATPLVMVAAMDPASAPAPRLRRSAMGWRPVGRIYRGSAPAGGAPAPEFWGEPRQQAPRAQAQAAAPAPGALARIGEAKWDGQRRVLAVPVEGTLARRGLQIRQVGDGRAYVDLPWSKPTFSGSRSADVAAGPISRWVMAAQTGASGAPATRLAFRLEGGALPRLELGGGELRVIMNAGSAAQAAARPAAAGGARVGEARYDVAAGVLSLPIEGVVVPAALRFKRLAGGRAYLDVAGARPAFSGTRQASYPGQALEGWKMAGHLTGGHAITRLAFTTKVAGPVDVRVVGGEIRLTLPGHTGIRSAPAPVLSQPQAQPAAEQPAISEPPLQESDMLE